MTAQDHEKLIGINAKQVAEVMNAPLKFIAPELHAEYKKDWNNYLTMVTENRNTEADAFLKKIIEKYDTPKDGV